MTRRSLLLLTTIVALPAATLVYLGVRLLQQDRELERQRRAEILQDASNRAISAFERELSALTLGLSDPVVRCSRRQPLPTPRAVGCSRIQQPVMQPALASLPEFDRIGAYAISAPITR